MGRIDGKYVVNPTWDQIETDETDLEIFIAGTKNAIMMVEGGAREIPEEEVLEAIVIGHNEIKKVVAIVEELRSSRASQSANSKPLGVAADVKGQSRKARESDPEKALRTKDKARTLRHGRRSKENHR